MFKNAKKLTAPAAKEVSKVPQYEIKGIRDLSAISLVIKTLQGIEKTLKDDVKSAGEALITKLGMLAKKHPGNIKGTDGDAFASIQMNKRASTSPLTIDEQTLLAQHNIPVTTLEKTPNLFVINPAYMHDQDLLAKVEQKLKGIKGLPEDFIMVQEGVTPTVTADNTIDAVFALVDQQVSVDTIVKLLSIVTTASIKPNFGASKAEDGGINEAFEVVEELLGRSPVDNKANAEVVAIKKPTEDVVVVKKPRKAA